MIGGRGGAASLARGAADFGAGVTAFSASARRYLLAAFALGLSTGAYGLLFNLYLIELGYETAFIGRVLAAQPLAMALASLPLGVLCDRVGRGRVFIGSAALVGIGTIGQALAPTPTTLTLLSLVLGVGTAGGHVLSVAFLTENSTPRERGVLFSAFAAVSFVAAAIGQLGGALVPNIVPGGLDLAGRYAATITASGALALVALVAMLPTRATVGAGAGRAALAEMVRDVRGRTGQFLAIFFLMGLSAGLTLPFLNLYFVQHLGASREAYGAISTLTILPSVIGPLVSPAVGRRWGQLRGFVVLRPLVGVFVLALALAPGVAVGAVALWLRALFFTASSTLYAEFVGERFDPRARATVAGLMAVGTYVATTVGTYLAGQLIAGWGYPAPYLVAAFIFPAIGLAGHRFFGRLPAPPTAARSRQPG